MRERERNYYSEEEYINLGAVLKDYIRYFKKRWYILILLIVFCCGLLFGYNRMTRTVTYKSTVSYTVEKSSSVYTNALITARLANGIYEITSTTDFREALVEAAGKSNIKAYYSFEGEATSSANMMTVTVRSSDSDTTKALIQAFETVYPEWAARSIGNAILTVKEEKFNIGPMVDQWSMKRIVVFGFAGGFLIWFVLATIVNLIISRVHNLEDMYKVINATCLGMIPAVTKKKRETSKKESLLISNENANIPYQQSIRALRHAIETNEKFTDKKVFLITSTLPEEGKSLITMNLALAFQKIGESVMVIDANLHSETDIQQILNLPASEKNLLGYLKGEYDTVDIQAKDGLQIICSDMIGEKESFIPDMKRFSELVEKMKESVDIVLIDASQTTLYSDAVLFSGAADAVIYVVRCDYTEIKDIRKGIEPFVQNQKLGGFVLNQLNEVSTGYKYYYGYGYGSGYSLYRSYGSDGHYGKYNNNEK